MVGTYLMFQGKCKEALGHYEKAFNVKVAEMQTYGDMPPNPSFPIPEEKKGLVLHSRFVLDGTEIMCADGGTFGDGEVRFGDNMFVSLTTKDEKLVKGAWAALKDGGHVYMELHQSFFALLHGSLRDKFGINWMFTVLG